MDNEVFGVSYIKTIPGLTKIVEIVLSLLTIICAMIFTTSWENKYMAFLNTSSLLALIYALVILLLSVINCAKDLTLPWTKIDCIMSILLSILLFCANSLLAEVAEYDSALTAAVVFGYANAIVFLGASILKILKFNL